eukprot:5097644-Pleurochrysis_carterae.AAC.2
MACLALAHAKNWSTVIHKEPKKPFTCEIPWQYYRYQTVPEQMPSGIATGDRPHAGIYIQPLRRPNMPFFSLQRPRAFSPGRLIRAYSCARRSPCTPRRLLWLEVLQAAEDLVGALALVER